MNFTKDETLFSKRLQKILKWLFFVQPIESEGTGLGIPDLYLNTDVYKIKKARRSTAWVPAWLELKDMSPVEDFLSAEIPFEAGQLNKLNTIWNSGCFSAVAIFHRGHLCIVPTPLIDRTTQRIKKECPSEAFFMTGVSDKDFRAEETQIVLAEAILTFLVDQYTKQRKEQGSL